MENKYVGDISDFAKFIILKYLFNDKNIGIVWYLTPDKNEPDYSLKFKVCEKNLQIFDYAKTIDKNLALQFNLICKKDAGKFYINKLESMQTLNNVEYFNECIVGACIDGKNYRKQWVNKALDKIKDCEIVYLDPDYGLPFDYRISVLKSLEKVSYPEKYLTIEEIKEFILGKDVLIFHNRYPVGVEYDKVHLTIFNRMKKEFKNKYCYIIKQNPFQPRFFVIISRYDLTKRLKRFLLTPGLCHIAPFKGFFTLIFPDY
jgi:hypothetical protein